LGGAAEAPPFCFGRLLALITPGDGVMIKRLLPLFVVTGGLLSADGVRFETLEMRYHWAAPEVWLVQISDQTKQMPGKKEKLQENDSVKQKEAPAPPPPTYRRIA
jgi:hypothetical protein